MRIKASLAKLSLWLSVGLVCAAALAGVHGHAAEMKLETLLIWGTNDRTSPDAKHIPVSSELKKKLQELPLKWTNYFEVKRIPVVLSPSEKKRVALSEKCALEVKNLEHSNIQVTLYGKGEQVVNRTQALPKNDLLILGGNAPGATSWFVVLRRLQ
jgi:hypothetical protein